MSDALDQRIDELSSAANAAMQRAYAPYSKFRVGAVVLTRSGGIHAGCNVENATYGATVCAERHAVAAAVMAGDTDVIACVITTEQGPPTPPCGICRQVLREFGTEIAVVSIGADGSSKRWSLAELLPDSFGPEDLDR